MLTFCGFIILTLVGFMFMKEGNKKQIMKLVKDNSNILIAVFILLFLISGINGYQNMGIEGFYPLNETLNNVKDSFFPLKENYMIEGMGCNKNPEEIP